MDILDFCGNLCLKLKVVDISAILDILLQISDILDILWQLVQNVENAILDILLQKSDLSAILDI